MLIIGIAGASGSGKSSLAQEIKAFSGDRCTVISADSYYKDTTHLPRTELADTNYDHPDTIDFVRLSADLNDLKNGLTAQTPIYNFSTGARMLETIPVTPNEIVIVEGILIFHVQTLVEQFDLKIYVHTDFEHCRERRIARDIVERHKNRADLLVQFERFIKPSYETFIAPTLKKADMVLSNDMDNPHNPFHLALPTISRAIEDKQRLTMVREDANKIVAFKFNPKKSSSSLFFKAADAPNDPISLPTPPKTLPCLGQIFQ